MLPLSLIIVDKAILYSLGAGVINQLSSSISGEAEYQITILVTQVVLF